jgi:hypothetical protein
MLHLRVLPPKNALESPRRKHHSQEASGDCENVFQYGTGVNAKSCLLVDVHSATVGMKIVKKNPRHIALIGILKKLILYMIMEMASLCAAWGSYRSLKLQYGMIGWETGVASRRHNKFYHTD